jgi:hypothetical protein
VQDAILIFFWRNEIHRIMHKTFTRRRGLSITHAGWPATQRGMLPEIAPIAPVL